MLMLYIDSVKYKRHYVNPLPAHMIVLAHRQFDSY